MAEPSAEAINLCTDEPPRRPAKRYRLTPGLQPQVLSLVDSDDEATSPSPRPGDNVEQSQGQDGPDPRTGGLWGALRDPPDAAAADAAAAAPGLERPVYRPPSARFRRPAVPQQQLQQQSAALPISPIVIEDAEERPTIEARRQALLRRFSGAAKYGTAAAAGQGQGGGEAGAANADGDSPVLTKVVPARSLHRPGPSGAGSRAGPDAAAAWGGALPGPDPGPAAGLALGPGLGLRSNHFRSGLGPRGGDADAGADAGAPQADPSEPPEAALAQMQLRSPPPAQRPARRVLWRGHLGQGPGDPQAEGYQGPGQQGPGQQGPGEPAAGGSGEGQAPGRAAALLRHAEQHQGAGGGLRMGLRLPAPVARGGFRHLNLRRAFGAAGAAGGGDAGGAAAGGSGGGGGAGGAAASPPRRQGSGSGSPGVLDPAAQAEADMRLAARLQAEEDEALARETERQMREEEAHGNVMAGGTGPRAPAVAAAAAAAAAATGRMLAAPRDPIGPAGLFAGGGGDAAEPDSAAAAAELAAQWDRLDLLQTLEEEAERAGRGRGVRTRADQRVVREREREQSAREQFQRELEAMREQMDLFGNLHAARGAAARGAARGAVGPGMFGAPGGGFGGIGGGGGVAALAGGGMGGMGGGFAAAFMAAEAAAAADAGAAVPGGGPGAGRGPARWSARNLNEMLPMALGYPFGMGRVMMGPGPRGAGDEGGPGGLPAHARRARNAAREAALAMREQLVAAQRAGIPPSLLLSDRDFTPEDYDLLLRLDEGLENRKGAREEQLAALPTQLVGAGGRRASDGGAARCAVCLEEVGVGEVLKRLPCAHEFHAGCVDTWLRTKACCPICQRGLED